MICNCGKVDCQHCGNTVDRSEAPAGKHIETCMNCHKPFGYEVGEKPATEPPEKELVYNAE